MAAKYIFGAAATIFLFATLFRLARDGHIGPESKAWLVITIIFATVSTWLWIKGGS